MNKTVRTAEELGMAIRNNENTIVIEGSVGNATLAIQAIGPVAWVVAIGALGVAVAGIFVTVGTGGGLAPAGLVTEACAAPALIAAFGSVGTASTALSIAVAGGGVGILSSLRKYKARKENGKVILTKRW